MRNEELRDQIEGLREEVRALGEAFQTLRQEDVRSALVRQVRPVLLEKVDLYLDDLASLSLPRSERAVLRRSMVRWLEGALEAFERGGPEGGASYAKEHDPRRAVEDIGIDQAVPLMLSLRDQLLSYFSIYTGSLQLERDQGAGREEGGGLPQAAESILGPLASAVRVRILQHLSVEDEGLATLGRALGMKKGHLQFHLRVLIEAGHIVYDRKSHMYSVSGRGERALRGVEGLVESLKGEQ